MYENNKKMKHMRKKSNNEKNEKTSKYIYIKNKEEK